MDGLWLALLILTWVGIISRWTYRLLRYIRRRKRYTDMPLEDKLEVIADSLPDEEREILLDASDFIGRIREWQARRESRNNGGQ